MNRFIVPGLLIAGMAILVTACKPDPNFRPEVKEEISFNVPAGWPQPIYNFQNNKLTQAGFDLGKQLFFDTRLSSDNSTSCGSCHQPFSAFAQFDHPLSHGVNDQLGIRNSPPLFNLNWHPAFFWDGGVNHIESQPINPITNPVEMNETVENIIAKVGADEQYKKMFTAAFGDETVTSQRLFKAMAQFMGMLVSSNSKYDKYTRGEAGGEMTQQELNGLNIFRQECASCHKEPLFSDFSYRNNGLFPTSADDTGRVHITNDPADRYKFKVPSLRNLKYTPPYMHDGRFSDLNAVLEHYASGINKTPTLDAVLQDGIQLTAQQKSDLLAFLNTLNDDVFVKDTRFLEPR